MTQEELTQRIKGKHILLDTGVIIRAFEFFQKFEDFFRLLGSTNCIPVYFPLIEFEFIRGAHILEHRQKREEFLKSVSGVNMPFRTEQIMSDAIRIANCYAARKINNPSVVDCCIAAYIKQFSANLLLVTLNHKDFPLFLFDRIFIYPIDTETDIFPLAFYSFNTKKAAQLGLEP